MLSINIALIYLFTVALQVQGILTARRLVQCFVYYRKRAAVLQLASGKSCCLRANSQWQREVVAAAIVVVAALAYLDSSI